MSRATAPMSPTTLQLLRRWISRRDIVIGQLIVAGVTAYILFCQTRVMDTQAGIAATQAGITAIVQAPNVVVNADWPASGSYISLMFRNIGHSNAYQLIISPYADWERRQELISIRSS